MRRLLIGMLAAIAAFSAVAPGAAAQDEAEATAPVDVLQVNGLFDDIVVAEIGAAIRRELEEDEYGSRPLYEAYEPTDPARLPTARLDRIAPYVMSHAAAISRRLGHVEDVPELDETRVAQELALLAVKADVTEEIERLTAHIAAARALLADGKPAGRRLDFLAQEFNREANTLCAKAGSAPLTAIGLDLKAEIDRMREQIQNVE